MIMTKESLLVCTLFSCVIVIQDFVKAHNLMPVYVSMYLLTTPHHVC